MSVMLDIETMIFHDKEKWWPALPWPVIPLRVIINNNPWQMDFHFHC
jgi:hypothetical protein